MFYYWLWEKLLTVATTASNLFLQTSGVKKLSAIFISDSLEIKTSSLGIVNLTEAATSSAGGTNPTPTTITLTNPLGNGATASTVLDKVTTTLIAVSAPIAAIMILIGGIQIMTSGGNEEKYKSGRKTITYTAIGFGVVVLAKSAALIIQDFLS